jgi:hypothetical protein
LTFASIKVDALMSVAAWITAFWRVTTIGSRLWLI